MRRAGSVVLVLANAALLLGGAHAAGLVLCVTDSLPLGLYRQSDESPGRGVLVKACLPASAARLATTRGYLNTSGACGDHGPVLKRIAAVAGDSVRLTDVVEINGRRLERAPLLHTDVAGRPLPRARNTTLARDELWLLADRIPESFDSRYFGPVRTSAVRAVVVPLWTF